MTTAAALAPAGVVERLRERVGVRSTFLSFAGSVAAVNVASLAGSAIAFRYIDPVSMGVWHTLALVCGYLTVARLGIVNGLGRDLPFALGRGDTASARRIASAGLAANRLSALAAALTFAVLLAAFWARGPVWRMAVAAMAIVSTATFHLTFLQATFRSDADFTRLARVHWIQAGAALLMAPAVYLFGFAGLCVHAALQAIAATACAHAWRPLRVRARFDGRVVRDLLAVGFPLFAAGYLQTLAAGFDRVILLAHGGVAAVGYYAPAVAVVAAMAIVPGAVATWVYPRTSYVLGQGRPRAAVRRSAYAAAAASFAVSLPIALAGWLAAPPAIARFFPRYESSIPAVRWSLLAGLLWSVAPAAQVLGSLKAWRSLAAYVAAGLLVRWVCPWWLSHGGDALSGVAQGNAVAGGVMAVVALVLVAGATRSETLREAEA
ncbi:MAG: oligosaccharide flippase family protein [Vicinamibacteria bacterium]